MMPRAGSRVATSNESVRTVFASGTDRTVDVWTVVNLRRTVA